MPSMPSPDDLLTTTQAGVLLDKSGRTVSRMADDGKLAFAQKLPGPNGAYLFRRSTVEAHPAAIAKRNKDLALASDEAVS